MDYRKLDNAEAIPTNRSADDTEIGQSVAGLSIETGEIRPGASNQCAQLICTYQPCGRRGHLEEDC